MEECQHIFFKEAIKEGILIEDRRNRTVKEKKYKEERYYYTRERYGHTLLNFTCRFFDESEDRLLMKYWGMLHSVCIPNHDYEPNIPLNDRDENSIVLLGKVKYIQESTWSETKGAMLSVETKICYSRLDGNPREDWINTKCIMPGKECGVIEKEISKNSNLLIKGFFRPEKGEYRFSSDNEVNVIVKEYFVIDDDVDLTPENGDLDFFIDRNEHDRSSCLNKVVLTGKISNIGFQVTRGYPHITLHLRTKIDDDKDYLETMVEIWEKHHNDCLKDINIGDSIWVEGYFKHPISQRYHYWYEPVDATVFAYKYRIL